MEVLAAWQTVLGPHPRTSSHTATTTFVTGSDGSGHVLKRVTGLADLGERRFRLESEYRVLRHLRAAGLPVALPLPTDEGRIFASVAGDDAIYTLTPRLPADDGAPAFDRIGAVLGRLHRALRTYPHDFPSWTIDLVPRTFDEAVRDVTSKLDGPAADDLLATLERRRPRLVEAMTALPSQRIHGDFHGGNVLVHDGEVSGIVDLDHLPIGPRIYDLAYFLANQLVPALTTWRELVEGYLSADALSATELAALAPVTFAVQFQLIGWNLTQPGFHWSRDHVRGLRWIDEHYDELCRLTTSRGGP